jgi:hypothetical protein
MSAKLTAPVGALLSGPGFVHGERSPVDVPAIEGLDRRLGLLLIAQLDKAKPFRAAHVSVGNHLGLFDPTMRLKQTLQIAAGHFIREVTDI